MRRNSRSWTMADFSNLSPDPVEATRRRHGFLSAEDLEGLERLVRFAARQAGGAELRLEDEGGAWFESRAGAARSAAWFAHPFAWEGTDTKGHLSVPAGPGAEALCADLGPLVLEILALRRLGADRRRNPRGPETASFVPGVVHELRNFAFAMGAGLDAFEARVPAAAGQEHAGALRKNLARLQAFIDELGEYGNPGALAFSLQPLAPVLAQAVALARPLAEARGVEVVSGAERIPVSERMDRPTLESALRRLVEVVILETREGGAVQLETALLEAAARPWLEVVIQGGAGRGRTLDAGRLFEPFHYRDKEMPRLGPALARRAVEAHGGQVAARVEEGRLSLKALLPVWLEAL